MSPHENHRDIRIGTIVWVEDALRVIPKLIDLGFESFELTCGRLIRDKGDLVKLAGDLKGVLQDKAMISCLGVYGNPLQDDDTREDFQAAVLLAKHFDCHMVCGFAGALEDRPVDQSMDRYREVFGEISTVAEGEGVKIGFENCAMGGTWERPRYNIAHSPRAWEMMFDCVNSDAIGLEWEPCHQMESHADPIAQIHRWHHKFVHLHGKDGSHLKSVREEYGTRSGKPTFFHRTPGFGDTNWTDVISLLRLYGWSGTIDIEGYHDPVYREDLEWTGQVRSLQYLKECRGSSYIPAP